MATIRTILHPTDFSPHCEAAFQLATFLAQAHDARLIILHVKKPWYLYSRASLYPNFVRRKAKLLDALRQIKAEDADIVVEHRLQVGDPVSVILRAADELRCDLIAMGTHGRSGVNRLRKRSTAEQVVRGASCPVLTVKASAYNALPLQRREQSLVNSIALALEGCASSTPHQESPVAQ